MGLENSLTFWPAFAVVFLSMLLRYGFTGLVVERLLKFFPHRKLNNSKNQSQVRSDILYSLISLLIFAFFIALTLDLYRRGWVSVEETITLKGFIHLLLMFIIQDTYFYWTHRWFHYGKVYALVHEPHHRSRQPSFWTSFAFHPSEALIQAMALPLLALSFYLEWWTIGVFLVVMTFMGFINHLGHEFYPQWWLKGLGRFMVSATHHQKHHLHYKYNFGLYFSVWDHLMGTEHHE